MYIAMANEVSIDTKQDWLVRRTMQVNSPIAPVHVEPHFLFNHRQAAEGVSSIVEL